MDALRTVKVELQTKRDRVRIDALPGERLLFAGLSRGLDLPYECASGACGSCQAQVLSAREDALRNSFPDAPAMHGLPPDRVLMCQTTCHDDAELRIFGRLARQREGEVAPRYLSGIVESSRRVGPSTFALCVRPESPMNYRPGQFAMLSVEGVEGYRAYSMTRAPQCGALEFVVRTKPGGSFSSWLQARARPGIAVQVFGPLGKAILPEKVPARLFAIAGGTGIAGILSVLEAALLGGHLAHSRATLIYGVRMLADAVQLDQLSTWVERARGQLEVVVAVGHRDVNESGPTLAGLTFVAGLVTDVAEARLKTGTDHGSTCFFLAGPPVVVDRGLALLCGTYGVPRSNVLFDRFQ